MPRFVILSHDHPQPHFDFMLEQEAALRTWRLEALPHLIPKQVAIGLPDHRLTYLDYEGPVSGNRGHVKRVAYGTYEVVAESENELLVRLYGDGLSGQIKLKRTSSDWEMHWLNDL